jgi:hypothetical protein
MRTITARYRGTCCKTGRPFQPGDVIIVLSRGRYALASASEPIDPDLAFAESLDAELAASDPDAASHAGAYLRRSIARGVSDIWSGYGGKEYYRNRNGLCEDAPCCGCCNA